MPLNYSDSDLDLGPAANSNTAGVADVSPEHAVSSLDNEFLAGVPAAAGMRDPAYGAGLAQTAEQQAVVASSPAVRTWAATAPPAHLAVTKDDFPSLARISSYMRTVIGNPLQDIIDQAVSSADSAKAAQDQFLKKPLESIGGQALGTLGVLSSPFAPVQQSIKRALLNDPGVQLSTPVFRPDGSVVLSSANSEVEREQIAERWATLGTFMLFGTGKPDQEPQVPKGKPVEGAAPEPTPPQNPAEFRSQVADLDAQGIAAVQRQIAAAKTQARSPAVMETYLEQQTPDRQVQVDPDKLLELAQQGHEPFPEHRADIAQASANGEPFQVSLSRYLARTSGQPFADELNSSTVFRQGGVSVEDAGNGMGEAPEAQAIPKTVEAPAGLSPEESVRYKNLAESSRDAVDEIVQAQKLTELFDEAKAVGATKDQFARYNNAIEEHIAEVNDKLMRVAYQQILRERKPDFVEAVKQHSATVEQELSQVPAIRARAYLAQGKGPLGEPIETPFKLDREDAIAKYGKDLGLPKQMFGKNGVSADAAAEVLGFPSGADMVRELAALNEKQGEQTISAHMKDVIRETAHERARAQLGFDLNPEAIRERASELINSPKIEDFLASDLQAYAKENGLPFDKDAVKAYAARRFEGRAVSEALDIRRLESFVAKDVKKLETALLKSDVPAAFRWKQALYLHQLELGATHKFTKVYNRAQRLFTRVAEKVSIPSVSQDALNWSKDVLATTGEKVRGNPADLARPINGHVDLASYIEEKNNEGAEILQVPVSQIPLKSQSVGQFRGIDNMVRAIMTWGKLENEVISQDKAIALHDALDQGIKSLARYDRFIGDQELRHPNVLQALDATRRTVDAWLVRTEQLLRDFGAGKFDSPFFQIVTKSIQDGRAYSMDKRLEFAKHFHGVSEEVGGGFDRWLNAKLPVDGLHAAVKDTSGGNLFVTNRDIMVAALHLGDQGALDAFVSGFKTDSQLVEAIVHTHATPEMWTAVRGILDAFDNLKPDIVAKYKARSGVTPAMVEPRAFAMPDGSVNPGGYFPISHDPAKLPKDWIKQNEAYSKMLGSPYYYRVSPSNVYLTARTGAVAPVSMSLDAVYSRLNQVIHDLAYRDPLAAANKFLLHPRMQEAISRKYGPEYVTRLKTYLQDIAGSESTNPIDSRISRALDYLSERQQISMIGFSPSTMLKHALTAQVQGMQQIGVPRYLAAVARTRLQPAKYLKQAMEESADVRHILSTYNEDAHDQFIRATQGKMSITKAGLSFAFHLVGASNRLVAVPLYDAAKLWVAEKNPGLDEESVRAAAGQMVRQALGSSGVTESPQIMQARAGFAGKLLRLTNPFMTFLNHMYNVSREIPQNLGYAGQNVDLGKALALILTAQILPIYIDQAIARKTLSTGKNVSQILGYWAEGLVHQNTAAVPVLNAAVAAGIARIDKAQPGGDLISTEMGGDIGQAAKDLYEASIGHKMTEAKIRNLIMAGGFISPIAYPSLEAVRLEEFFHKASEGKEADWQTILHDLTIGPSRGTAN